MKRVLAVGAFIVLSLMAFVAWQSMGGYDSSSQGLEDAERISTASALGVEEFMRNVEQYRQSTVTVEGVVSTVSAENQLVGLIDVREFQECKITTCSALTLPIHWSGSSLEVFLRNSGRHSCLKISLIVGGSNMIRRLLYALSPGLRISMPLA